MLFKKVQVYLLLFCFWGGLTSYTPPFQKQLPKNIIFMIGDGMGLSQISAHTFKNNNKSIFEFFPVVGFHKCHSANRLITDSGAGATAFATGHKTNITSIGVDTLVRPLTNIFEIAKAKRNSTGLVVTSRITGATPAAFYAHQKFRTSYPAIAKDFVKAEIDFAIGGGKKFFDQRNDDQNLIDTLKRKGWQVFDFIYDDVGKHTIDQKKPYLFFTANDNPLPVNQGRSYLPKATHQAMNYLKNQVDNGFFLMVEGSQIDWAGHQNHTDWLLKEMDDFDKTIQKVLRFAIEDGETLVIVTADHETGGFAIEAGSKMKKIVGRNTTIQHTGTLIPVFAFGPGSEKFRGIYENSALFDKMLEVKAWETKWKTQY